ncbi:MAG: Asp-tRNA(Asn)/Glu-tRNA(Gln) amidotransferase subunit GatC [Pseudomonadota bacterium]
MSLTPDEVKKIAHLARLSIGEKQVPDFVDNLSRIIDFVQQLESADTAGVQPMAHPVPSTQRLRADEVSETDHRERYQRNASSVQEGLYLVPRVIE